MDLADRIRTQMKSLNLTQEALAHRAEISQAMVYKLLSRKSKSTTKIVSLAAALECNVEWLATGNVNKEQVNEEKASYTTSSKMSASELKKQLQKLPKSQQKSIALSIMQDLMNDT